MADKKRNFNFLVDYYPEKADEMYPPLACLEFVLRPLLICRESSPTGKRYREYEEEASQTHSVAQEYIDFLFYSDRFKSLNYISRGSFCVEFSIILDRIKNGFRNGKRDSLMVDMSTFFIWIIRAMASIARLTPHCFPEINFNKEELWETTASFARHKTFLQRIRPFIRKSVR